jgi:hypothetical protein
MRRWTTEEEVKFSVMYLGGVPIKKISQEMDRPVQGLYYKALKLNITNLREVSVPGRAKFIKYHEIPDLEWKIWFLRKKHSNREIGRMLGLTKSQVQRVTHRNDLHLFPPKTDPPEELIGVI